MNGWSQGLIPIFEKGSDHLNSFDAKLICFRGVETSIIYLERIQLLSNFHQQSSSLFSSEIFERLLVSSNE